MKILYVCHRFPFPPNRGGKIRPFNMIRHFTEQGHEVTVASLARSHEEARQGEGLREHCHRFFVERISRPAALARMVARLPSGVPSSMGYFYSPRLKRHIAKAVQANDLDLVFAHCSSVAQYVSGVTGVPKILDFGDMDSQKWLLYSRMRRFPLSMGYLIEGTKLQRAEAALATKFDICTCTTRAERETLESYGTGTRTDWFPNGVDADYFSPSEEGYEADTVCFIGRMDYYPNQQAMFDFCDKVLPELQARRASTKLTIVGASPPASVLELADRPGVTVTGSVPDVRPHVRKAALTVAPLQIARGTQNKILESMAMGVPVVASEQAAGGVDAVPGEHFLTASSPETYRDRILGLLEDRAARAALAAAGRQRVLSHHSWAHSMRRLDGIVADCRALHKTN